MNNVSWRSILEQADGREPFEKNTDERKRRPRQARKMDKQENADWSGLEAELQRATHSNTDKYKTEQRQATPRRLSPGQHATQLQMRMQKASAQTAPSAPSFGKDSRTNGTRNLIAVTLSFTVIAFAGYKLSEHLQGGTDQPEQHASASVFTELPPKPAKETTGTLNGGTTRLDLRPSLATRSDWSTENLSARSSQEEIASVSASGTQSPTAEQIGIDADANGDELSIIQRGHEILQRGQVESARLIFEYLADRGSPLGAFALAQTYDANFIKQNALPVDSADETLAYKWYKQAADLTPTANNK